MTRFIPPSPADKGNAKKTQSQRLIDGLRMGKSLKEASAVPSLEVLYEEKLASLKMEATGKNSYQFQLPGTENGAKRELSASSKKVLEQIAMKKAKKEEKKLKEKLNRVEISPKYLVGAQGGRVDAKGNIYDGAGQWILSVDIKTGKIKNRNGNVVGKYSAYSSFSEHQLCELVDKYDTRKKGDFRHGTKGHGNGGGGIWGSGGSIWGSSAPADSGGGENIWGGVSGNVWGGSSSGNVWGESSKNNIWGNKADKDGGFWG